MTQEPVPGYPGLADFMARVPEANIFRRFYGLNARNLMYMQAELCDLEARLLVLEEEDAKGKSARSSHYAFDFYWMLRSSKEADHQQLDLVLKIRAKLEKYSKSTYDFSHYQSLISA
jgi:hypothetical protein